MDDESRSPFMNEELPLIEDGSRIPTKIINGPITLGVVVAGTALNILTIYILSTQTLQRHRPSMFITHSPQAIKRVSNTTIERSRTVADSHLANRRRFHRSQSSVMSSASTCSRPRVYTFFLWLVVSDIFLLMSALFLYSIPNLLNGMGFYVRLLPFFYLMSNAALIASVWLMCALMFDRYRTLCQPFAVKSNNIPLIHKALFGVAFTALLFSIPRFFELHSKFDPEENEYYIAQTELVNDQIYMIGYRIVGGLLFYSVLPYVVLFILSFRVWLVIRSAAIARIKMNASGNSSQAGANDSEMILIAVISKFLLSRLLPTVLDVVEHVISPQIFTRSQNLTLCVDLSNLIVVLSAAINMIIFYVFSSSFRRCIHGMLRIHPRLTIASPTSPLSPTSLNSSTHKPRLPRQLSLQAHRKRTNPLNRKGTVSGAPMHRAQRDHQSKSPLLPVNKVIIPSSNHNLDLRVMESPYW